MEYKKKFRYVINFMYYTFIIAAIFLLLKYGLGLFAPFILAFLIAFIVKTPARHISKRFRLPYSLIAIVSVLLFYFVIVLVFALIGVKLFSLFADFVMRLPGIYEVQIMPNLISTYEDIEKWAYELDPAVQATLNEYFKEFILFLGESISGLSVAVIAAISGFASSLPMLLLKTLMMVISSFFIAVDYDKIVRFIIRQFSERGKELILQIKGYIVGTLFVYIRSYLLIMSITFIELSIGFTLLGLERAAVIALLIAIFDILPVLGTGGIMVPWIIISLIQGNYSLTIGLLIIYLIVTVVRNIIEPRIVGKRIGLHPVVTLTAMFVGARLFGVLGLFGFPITLSLLCYLNRMGSIKLFR